MGLVWPAGFESGFEAVGSGFGFKKKGMDSDSAGFGFELSGFGSGFEIPGFAHHCRERFAVYEIMSALLTL